ncbi:MAG: protein kinase domain-containing protein [Verrucomicrobiales bacterium]
MAQPLRFQHFEVLTRPDGSPHVLGKGAMGLTYKAFDRNLLSLAVVKVIAPALAGRPEARQRFLQEAQNMAKIKHPHIADVFYLGDSPQGVFYAMEFCDGPSVQEYVEEHGALDPGDVLTFALQAASALQAVESHHLIHRDIKPSNVLLVNDVQGKSQIKLIDFGLARDLVPAASGDPGLSQGGFVGTPTFASPEQLLEQEDLDIRSDLYSLGVTLWFMLSGRPPFSGSQFEVMFHHVNSPPPWERLPVMSEGSLAVLRRLLEKNPGDRFQRPGELVDELQRVMTAEGFAAGAGPRLAIGPRRLTGSVVGMSSFEILAEADSDPTGKVFRARDAHSGQTVALKYLLGEVTAKPEVVAKIHRHVLSLRPLAHPNLLGVLGFEKSDDGAKIILEWARGPSLLSVLKARNQLTLKEAASLLGQIAGALDFAAARGLTTLETDLHQIMLVSAEWGEDPASWAKALRQPVSTWKEVAVKINPLRLSPAAQDYPSLGLSAPPDASSGGPKPLLGAYLHLVYRLLGGAGGSQSSSMGGFVSLPGLGAEANDLLESFSLPPFTPEKRETTCAALLRDLCRLEAVAAPEIFEPAPEPEEDLMKTRDASVGASGSSPFPVIGGPGSQPGAAAVASGGPPSAGVRLGSSLRLGSQGRSGATSSGSASGSSAGRISADFEIKRRELELQRQRLEAEAERLKQEEVLEATRAMLEEERGALAEAKNEFARQERERAQRAEQERRKLEDERKRLESRTAEVEAKRREQERLEQEIQLRAQLEFQKFEEERRQREADWLRQREDVERSLKEREEQSFLREQQSFKKLREERERLQRLQEELEQGRLRGQEAEESALRQQVASLEQEREALAGQQAELERRLLAQNQEFASLRERFEQAERELETRHQRLAAEQAAEEARRREEFEAERRRLADERTHLEAQRAASAAERAAGTELSQAAARQREETEASLRRLAEEEARLATERQRVEAQRAERESHLAEELAQARRELESERAALAAESERVRQSGLESLEAERTNLAAIQGRMAEREAALSAELEEKARQLEGHLAAQREHLESERAAIAVRRQELDAEHQRLTQDFTREKEALLREAAERREGEETEHRAMMLRRAEELSRLEREEQSRLDALRSEISAEEARLQQQKQEVFSQERLITRMDQEASFQDQEALEELEAAQTRLERQRGELEQKLAELHRAQKRRLVTIVVGTIIGVASASAAGYYIKGRLVDPVKLKGQEAWGQFENERQASITAADWSALLNWCVATDDRFENQETDPVIKNFYKEKRGVVLADAGRAVNGLLQSIENGWKPPPPDDAGFKKLRQNLDVVAQWDGIPSERLLLLAKLDLPYLTAQRNPSAALTTYAAAVRANPAFVERLQPELAVTVQGLLDDFLPDRALDDRDAVFAQLRALPPQAQNSAPRIWLLMHLLKSEEARSGRATVENFELALRAVNMAATSEDTKAFFSADPEWAAVLKPQLDRVIATIKEHPESISRLEEILRATADQWKTDVPYMMLAGALQNQKKLDYYLQAEQLTGNTEAAMHVGRLLVDKAGELLGSGAAGEARSLVNDQAIPRLTRAADAGLAFAQVVLSDIYRKGMGGAKDLNRALTLAEKARDLGDPNASLSLGLCYLEKGEESKDPALLRPAVAALQAAATQDTTPSAARAWFFLGNAHSLLGETPQMVAALEKGAALEDPEALYMLGRIQDVGPPYYPTSNLTLARENITKAARAGDPRVAAKALEWLQENARAWRRSGLPADRDWLRQNEDLVTP